MGLASILPGTSQDRTTIEAALITAGFAFVCGLIGYFLKYYLDRKQAFSSENARIKREAYCNYVKALVKATSQINDTEASIDTIAQEFRKSTDEFYSNLVLYASPKVVRAYMHSTQNKISDSDPEHKYELLFNIGRVYKEMRKDMGLSNRRLGWNGEVLLRTNITNYGIAAFPYVTRCKRLAQWLKTQWHNVMQQIRKVLGSK